MIKSKTAGRPARETRPRRRPWKGALSRLGPGLVTGASDDDPSGIATYTQAGAAFGTATLWTSVLTLPLMVAVQEMCARIGLVTAHGLTGIIKRNYPRPVLWGIVLLSLPAIVLNIGANLSAMGAVAAMALPGPPAAVYSIAFGIAISYAMVALPYRRIARVLRWLCLSLLCYLFVPLLVEADWPQVLRHALLPGLQADRGYVAILVALFGTTISPYLFFWQASMEVEEAATRRLVVDKHVIREMRADVRSGMFFSNLVSFFIILTGATVLFPAGAGGVDTVEEAAAALRPLAGEAAYLLFALGVVGTGLLAVPVLAGAVSYMVSETLGWEEGLDKKFNQARGFYGVMVASVVAAILIGLAGMSPVRALILTATVYGCTAPVLIGLILHICNNATIMGPHVNGRWSNLLGGLALMLMALSALALLWMEWIAPAA